MLLTTPDGLGLRPWRADDAPAVRTAFAAPLMERQVRALIRTEEDALAWISRWAPLAESDTAYAFAVTAGDDAAVGHVCVSAVDRRHGTGWVSYWTTPAARGHGIASRATRAMGDWALSELGLHRLELGHRTDNPASCAVALAAGFRIKGLERAELTYDDTRFDVELHTRLATP